MREYELMVVVVPQLADEDLTGTLDQVSGYIAQAGGEVAKVLKENPWGRRRLAYPIRHNSQDVRDGFYAVYQFRGEATSITDLERNLRLNDKLLRHIVVRPDSDAA